MATKVQRICQTTKDITQKCSVRPVCVNVFATYFLLLPAKCLEFSNKVSNFAGRLLNLSNKNYNLFTNNKRLITMKQKLFTLLTLLLCAVTSSWAIDITETFSSIVYRNADSNTTKALGANVGISSLTLSGTVTINSSCFQVASGATGGFTVTTPTGYAIKTITFKENSSNKVSSLTCSDGGTTKITGPASKVYTYTATSTINSVTFTWNGSGGNAQIKDIVVTMTNNDIAAGDYEFIKPTGSVSENNIPFTSSLGDGKLLTSLTQFNSSESSSSSINFGNGKGFTIVSERAIKEVYFTWIQRSPTQDSDWGGFVPNSTTAVGAATGTHSMTANKWTAADVLTKSVTFKRNVGNTAKIASFHVIYYPSKEISSQTLSGVKKGETTLTETTDYTVSGSVITLTAAHKTAVTPSDIKLIKHITYTDESTLDQDVTVTFDGTKTDGYFVSDAATIGETNYTVKVPVDATPTLTLSATSADLTSLKSYQVGVAKVTVSGVNLSGSTFTAPTVEGLTISPASVDITDGAFSQEFTIKTTATTAANTVIGFAHTGATTQNYTVTYSKTAQRTLEQADVTATTTWDWTKAGENVQLKEDGTTDPAKNEDFLLSNIAEINNDANFNSQALFVNLEYAQRDSKYMQGSTVTFNTTKPGTVAVTFSNTGNRNNDKDGNRYVYINGTNTGVSSWRSSDDGDNKAFQTAEMTVPAGTVVINSFDGNGAATMVRISKIVFTANDALEQESVAITCEGGIASFCSTKALDFGSSSVKAYIVTTTTAESVTLTEVTKTPANTGLIIAGGTKGETVNVLVTDGATDDVTANLLKAATTAKTVADGEAFALSKTDGLFHPVQAGLTIPAGKAYMLAADIPSGAHALSLDFGGGTTGIKAVESQKVAMDNKFYNLAGQQVAAPTKGLYIVNGKKVIIK